MEVSRRRLDSWGKFTHAYRRIGKKVSIIQSQSSLNRIKVKNLVGSSWCHHLQIKLFRVCFRVFLSSKALRRSCIFLQSTSAFFYFCLLDSGRLWYCTIKHCTRLGQCSHALTHLAELCLTFHYCCGTFTYSYGHLCQILEINFNSIVVFHSTWKTIN